MVSQRLDIDNSSHIARAAAVLVPRNDAAEIVENERSAAECIYRRSILSAQEIGSHVGRDYVEIVVQSASPALNLEDLVTRRWMRIRAPIHEFGSVERECACIFRVRSFIGH